MDTSDSHSRAVEQLDAARDERDRRTEQYDAACGSPNELPAFTELQQAQEQLTARRAWVEWAESDH